MGGWLCAPEGCRGRSGWEGLSAPGEKLDSYDAVQRLNADAWHPSHSIAHSSSNLSRLDKSSLPGSSPRVTADTTAKPAAADAAAAAAAAARHDLCKAIPTYAYGLAIYATMQSVQRPLPLSPPPTPAPSCTHPSNAGRRKKVPEDGWRCPRIQ